MQRIADTGLLKAVLDQSDTQHTWDSQQFRAHSPFHTCEAVLNELAFLLGDPRLGLKLLARGDLLLTFHLAPNAGEVLALLEKYADRPWNPPSRIVSR